MSLNTTTRIRTIKPEMALNEDLADLEFDTSLPIRFAWAVLPCHCDREGRFEWRPRKLGALILPYDNVDFSRVLDAMLSRGLLVKYRVNGAWFGCIPTFKKHQVINNKESDSRIPSPVDAEEFDPPPFGNAKKFIEELQELERDGDATSSREARDGHGQTHSLNLVQEEGKGREGKGKEKGGGASGHCHAPPHQEDEGDPLSAEQPPTESGTADDENQQSPLGIESLEAKRLPNGRMQYPNSFESFWAAYPARNGPNPKKAAYKKWIARIRAKEATPDRLLRAAEGYARYAKADGALATQWVKQAEHFLNADGYWDQDWDAMADQMSQSGERGSPSSADPVGDTGNKDYDGSALDDDALAERFSDFDNLSLSSEAPVPAPRARNRKTDDDGRVSL